MISIKGPVRYVDRLSIEISSENSGWESLFVAYSNQACNYSFEFCHDVDFRGS